MNYWCMHLMNLIQDETFLNRFAAEQKISRREGWYDNLAKAILSPNILSTDEDSADTDDQEIQKHLLKLNNEFETDKDALMKLLASQGSYRGDY